MLNVIKGKSETEELNVIRERVIRCFIIWLIMAFFIILIYLMVCSIPFLKFKIEGIEEGREESIITYLYFSIVTFTTLGFGDVTPLHKVGEIWLAIEVILGYIMLGGLISIFANKFARRS